MSSQNRPLFSSMLQRSSTGFPRRAAPSSFVSAFSKQPQSKPANDDLLLPLDCAFFLPHVESLHMDRYFLAVGDLLGGEYEKIKYGGKNGAKVVMHLDSKVTLQKFVSENEFVVIEEHRLPVKRIVDPGLTLFLQNVVPHLPNDVLVAELKRHVRLMSDLALTPYGMKDPRLRHILAYKRQVQIPTDDKEKVPISITVTWRNVPYIIYLTFDSPRCYTCGKEGHISKDCPEVLAASFTAQKRLENIKTPASLSSDQSPPPPSEQTPPPPAELTPLPPSSSPSEFDESEVDKEKPEDESPSDINMEKESSSSSTTIMSSDSVSSPVDLKNDFFPPFGTPSLPSLVEDANNSQKLYPDSSVSLQDSQNKKRKEENDSIIHNEKKPKFNASPRDAEQTIGFKCMVEKLIQGESDMSICAVDVCELLSKVKNSQKQLEVVQESGLPLDEVKKVLLKIHTCADTSTNMKSRVNRLLKNLSGDSKMVLRNVEYIAPKN